jgi:serine protease Do
VVRGAEEIKVSFPDKPDQPLAGKVIGRDERTDLAVIKIKANRPLPYAKLGNSDQLKIGDWAIAVGSPFGLAQTVTVGVISATRQNLAIQGRNYTDLIQTDAAINPGNSGGPLANIHGEVIGINTAIFSPSGGFAGIGFALPINRAKEIIPQLKEKGKVVRGWIGVVLEEKIDEATAKVFDIPDGKGALVRQVIAGYPAAQAGIQRGDVMIEFNRQKINNNSDLQKVVGSIPPNTQVPVKIIRNKKEMTLNLKIGEAPESTASLKMEERKAVPSEQSAAQEQWIGAAFADIMPALQQRLSIPESEKGVIVITVDPGSKAETIGLMTGDLIRAVNQQAVPDLKTFKETIKKVDLRKGVVFDILRRGQSLYLSYIGPEK